MVNTSFAGHYIPCWVTSVKSLKVEQKAYHLLCSQDAANDFESLEFLNMRNGPN